MRHAIDQAVRVRLTTRQWRAFAAVLHLTGSYSKVGDAVWLDQVAEIAELPRQHTSSALNELRRLAVLAWVPARGRGKRSWVSLVDDEKRSPLLVNLSPEETSPNQLGKHHQISLENVTSAGDTPEEFPRRPRQPLFIITDCMACFRERPCLDDGHRIVCDECRKAA